jgi:long-chain fatty acid transport protein
MKQSSGLCAPHIGILLVLVISLAGATAQAGGYTFPENGTKAVGRGGAYGLGGVGPEALYFNPALLSRLRGYQLTLDLNLANQTTAFQRAPEGEGEDRVTFPEIRNRKNALPCCSVFPAPMLFASADFGIKDFAVAAGVYGPSAYGTNAYPENGPQRFILTEADIIQVYYSLAAAYHREGWRVGGTLQLTHLSVDLTTTASAGSSSRVVDSEDPSNDAYTTLNVDDIQPTGILGVAYDFSPALSVGLSYKLPVSFEQTGPARVDFASPAFAETISLDSGDATFRTNEADLLRGGARYAYIDGLGREVFDVELTGTYEFWSRQDKFEIELPDLVLNFNPNNPIYQPVEPVDVPKKWKDSWSLRLGGDFNATPWLSVRLGGFYETSPIPESTTHLDFISFDRWGGSLGATVLVDDFEVDLGYLYTLNATREVDNGELRIIAPLVNNGGQGEKAINNGTYEADLHVLSLGVTWRFGAGERNLQTPRVAPR